MIAYVCLISFFQGCTVFLCDFHREQAWERWVAKSANNVSNCKDELFGRMREIAHVEDMTKFNAAVDKLKATPRLVCRDMAKTAEGTLLLSCIWQSVFLKRTSKHKSSCIVCNLSTHDWLLVQGSVILKNLKQNNTYKRCCYFSFQRWALVFQKEVLPVAINTTNGVERQNKEFKFNFLSKHRDKTLSRMLTVLIEDFLQDKYARYLK